MDLAVPPKASATATTTIGDWLHSFCVVNFDLEVGQSLEFQYPPDAELSEADKANLCYMAFPDSNSGCMGDSTFHFRICPQYDVFGMLMNRNNDSNNSSSYDVLHAIEAKYALTEAQTEFNRNGPAALQLADNVLFGFVFFRQCRDSTIRRGYMQKSLVVLSRWPLPQLWVAVLNLVAPEFFKRNNDRTILECVARDISRWPAPDVGVELHLPVMGHVIRTQLPDKMFAFDSAAADDAERHSYRARQFLTGASSSPIIDVPNAFGIDLYEALHGVMTHVHVLWELVLLQEPLVIIGTSPTQCSMACQALVQCIWPLRYAADYRPFFTIHDPNFRRLSSSSSSSSPTAATIVPRVMLGVTNPFFAKALDHWPHIVRLAEDDVHVPPVVPVSTLPAKLNGVFLQTAHNNNSAQNNNNNNNKFKQRSTRAKLYDSKPGLYSEYLPFLHKHDKVLLRQLTTINNSNVSSRKQSTELTNETAARQNAAILRRHLLVLTQSFMLPLERYVSSSLMPLQRNVNPFRAAPQLKPFVEEDFVSMLEQSGPQLTTGVRGDWQGLYKRFFRTDTFNHWLLHRSAEINDKLEVMHLEALVASDLSAWARHKSEVEQIDMVLRLKRLLDCCPPPAPSSASNGDDDESRLESKDTVAASPGVQQFVATRRADLQHRLEALLSCIPVDARQLIMPL